MQQKNGIPPQHATKRLKEVVPRAPRATPGPTVGGFWGPSRSTPFVRNNPLVFFRDPKKRNPITADGIFVGHTLRYVGFYTPKKKKDNLK